MPGKLFTLLLLAALPAFRVAAADADRTIPLTGKATGLRFTGHYRDDAGRRRWLAEADTARSGAKPGAWLLERIRLTTFDQKSGNPQLVIVAPAAAYEEKEGAASDPGPVTMEGDMIRLTGRDWRWTNAADSSTFAIASSVRVVLTPPAAAGKRARPPTLITSDRLDVRVTPGGRRLAFAGHVRVQSKDDSNKDAVLTCGELVVTMPGSDDPTAAAKDAAFKSIDASGGVRLEDNGAVITGRTGRILPGDNGKGLYTVSGDALFEVVGDKRIAVRGETMRFDAAARRIEVDPPADSADGRVSAEFPSIDAVRAANPTNTRPSRASGKRLDILVGDNTGTLLFTGDVRLDDPDYDGTCDRLAVDFGFDRKRRFTTAAPDTSALRKVVAEDRVSLHRNDTGHAGYTVVADRAEFFPDPDRRRVVLTGSPRANDPDNGLTVSAARVTIESLPDGAGMLTAESDPTRRVRATFDARGATNTKLAKLPKAMTVEAALLVGESAPAPTATKDRVGRFRFEGGVVLSGEDIAGHCDHIGIEVSSPPTRGAKAVARVRHAVATGRVLLDLKRDRKGCIAEAGRAEIWPEANLKELAVADADGLDGESPLYVTLERDGSSPGLRPVLTVSGMGVPSIDNTPATGDTAAKGSSVIEADHQELILGERRLRAFARGGVSLKTPAMAGTASTLELLATEKTRPDRATGKPDTGFTPDAIIARGGVKLLFKSDRGDRDASCDTLEIYLKPDDTGLLALDGHPYVKDIVTPPGTTRKTMAWQRIVGADGKTTTVRKFADETGRGETRQITRPRILLPVDNAPDLARPIKNLDNAR